MKASNYNPEEFWQIGCDGYYPYCPVCNYEYETNTNHLPKQCPNCKTKLKKLEVSKCR